MIRQKNSTVDIELNNHTTITITTPNDGEFYYTDDGWDHKLPLVVQTSITNYRNPKHKKNTTIPKLEFLEYSTGTRWHNDENGGLYTMVDGKKIYQAEYEKGSNCETALGLNKEWTDKNPGACEKVAICLLQFPEELVKCLKQYKDPYDMFDVAQDELKNLAPTNAKKLLNIFHVKMSIQQTHIDKKGHPVPLKQPMSFSQWEDDFLNNDSHITNSNCNHQFKELLKKSKHLQNYVKGIIEFVRSNPAILNTHWVEEDETEL